MMNLKVGKLTLQEAKRFGRFVVQAEAVSGGMGDVYRGHDPLLDRTVALKVMQDQRRLSTLAKVRFMREARLLSKLEHPNICRIHDFIESDERDVLVLEYLEGATLKAAIRLCPITVEDTLSIAFQVASALAAAHQSQIVHRDLKPDNVMILRDKTVKVLDFGLARSDDRELQTWIDDQMLDKGLVEDASSESGMSNTKTTVGSLVGTLAYMSPEQARGDAIEPATDIYALGVIMIEMLTGRRAYPDDIPTAALLGRVAFGKLLPYEREIIDPEIRALVDELVAPHPDDRPSADDVVQRLQLLRSRADRRKRKRVVASLLATFILLLTLLVATSLRAKNPTWVLPPDQTRRVQVKPIQTPDRASNGWNQLMLESLSNYRMIDAVADEETSPADFVVETQLTPTEKGIRLQLTIFAGGKRVTEQISAPEPLPAIFEAVRRIAFQIGAGGSYQGESHSTDPLLNEIYALGSQMVISKGHSVAVPYFEICTQLDPNFYRARLQLAECHLALSQPDQAERLVRQLLQEEDSDSVRLAKSYLALGKVLQKKGHTREALDAFQQAEKHATTASDQRQLASTWLSQSSLIRRSGDVATARQLLNKAYSLFDTLDDAIGRARAAYRLGYLERTQGHYPLSLKSYEEALHLYRAGGHLKGLARTLMSLGSVNRLTGDLDAAEACYDRAMALHIESQDMEGQATAINYLGGIAVRRYDYEKALALFEQANAIYKATNEPADRAMTLHNIGWAALQLNRTDEAEPALGESLAIYSDLGDQGRIASVLISCCQLNMKLARWQEAEWMLRHAEWTFETLLDQSGLGRSVFLRAELGEQQGQQVLALYEQALNIFCETDELEGTMHAAFRMANIHQEQGRTGQALEVLSWMEMWQRDHILTFEISARIADALGDDQKSLAQRNLARAAAPRTWEVEFSDYWQSSR